MALRIISSQSGDWKPAYCCKAARINGGLKPTTLPQKMTRILRRDSGPLEKR